MIKDIIYHILNKKQYSSEGTLGINPNQLIPNDSHRKFLDQLNKAYTGRAGKGYGIFNENEDIYPMPRLLREYLSDNNFHNLTERMMNILLNKVNNQRLATGGKVFIIHYESENNIYILVAILSEKAGFLAQDWQITENEILDIEHLKFAGRVNLTAWQNNDESRYISFLKGKDDVSEYFKEFLACNDALIASIETKKLVKFLEEFASDKQFSQEEKTDFFERAKNYLAHISDNNEPFVLETFSNQISPKEPQLLKERLGGENGVSDGFIPDKRSIKSLSTYTGKTKHWSLFFTRDAINNGDIYKVEGKIIINNPTESILKAFD